jgi:nitrite reductase/ring-hydroxylating ferredoxin subunit
MCTYGFSLAEGTLEGYTITCLCHDWRFDVRTGEFLYAKEIKIPKYELKRSEGRIFVKIYGRIEKSLYVHSQHVSMVS